MPYLLLGSKEVIEKFINTLSLFLFLFYQIYNILEILAVLILLGYFIN